MSEVVLPSDDKDEMEEPRKARQHRPPEWKCTAETLQSWYTGSAAVAEITVVVGAMKYDPQNLGLGSSSTKDDGFGGTPAEDHHLARLARTELPPGRVIYPQFENHYSKRFSS
ncbi:hypothetical protein E2C01_010213 [Portunus trituberculatus]|uniref:Uncharacterized protein n=1 Tax=Portunus trituberculatus TaxID=210409 RepID=A0A5B7D7W8_PORTR|nr:hypothetical protein [Portunus trituberculatus]